MRVRRSAAFKRFFGEVGSGLVANDTSQRRRAATGQRGTGAPRALLLACALVATAGLVVAGGAVAQGDGVGKVLVFTGTDGTPNASTDDAVDVIEGIGDANDFGVDVSDDAADINATNLGDYRAVAFVHSAGDVLDSSQRSALQDYVNHGGGFVGIGETANLQPDESFFDTLIGARPDAESSGDTTAQDVEFLDRVHPATRDLPVVHEGHSDIWYEWDSNPTGSVHTVARARFGSIPTVDEFPGSGEPPAAVTEVNIIDEGDSVVSDTVKDDLSRPVSWCRDIQEGRSFYTAMGRISSAYETDEIEGQLAGAIQWAAGMVRGNCKATINSNYEATRLTPPNAAGEHDIIGEAVDMDVADDGLVFYVGRASCHVGGGGSAIPSWNDPNVGRGCGTIHVWDPSVEGPNQQNADKVTHVETLDVFGHRGGGAEVGLTGKSEHGLTGIALDPDFTNGRPYIYLDYWPYDGDELGPGFQRHTFLGERRTSRFTYDFEEKALVDGSERVIFHYMTQVYACCHHGGSMAFDSEGNLHVPSGDSVGNNPNSANGGYQQAWHGYTIPPFGTPEDPPRGDCSANDNRDLVEGCWGGDISYGDARTSSGNTATYEGAMIRIRPVANPPAQAPGLAPSAPTVEATTPDGDPIEDATPADWGLGTHYALPDGSSPNGPNMYGLTSPEVQAGLAKPEIYSMGLRNFYSVEIDPDTDLISGASVGPDMNSHNNTWGLEGHSVHTLLPEAGNYLGWPFCWGNGIGYRKKLPSQLGGGAAAPVGTPGTIPGPPYNAEGQPEGGWNNCSDPILNDSPFNNGLETIPAPKPVNFWWGRSNMGCPDYRRDQNLLPINFVNDERFERCPFAKKVGGGGQAGMTGGFYRMSQNDPSMDEPAWPEYWEGRWFLFNYSSPNTTRHAALMPENPTNESEALAVDNLTGIIPGGNDGVGNNAILGHEFGPDGALYLLHYGGSFFNVSNSSALWRFTYRGGGDTPGPDPQLVSVNQTEVELSIGKSGGVEYAWDFGDGNTAEGANPTHTYDELDEYEIELTVTYADGEEASETITLDLTVPNNLSAPTLAGTGKVGTMQTCHQGTWDRHGDDEFSWTLDGEPVEVGTGEGQTGSTNPKRYRAKADEAGSDIVCHVVRTDEGGSSEQVSSNAITVGDAPVLVPENVEPPTLSGSGKVGTMLTCAAGTWTLSGSYSFEWLLDGEGVPTGTGPGETGSTNPARYRAKAGEVGDDVVCRVTRTNSHGTSAPADSNAVTINAG